MADYYQTNNKQFSSNREPHHCHCQDKRGIWFSEGVFTKCHKWCQQNVRQRVYDVGWSQDKTWILLGWRL